MFKSNFDNTFTVKILSKNNIYLNLVGDEIRHCNIIFEQCWVAGTFFHRLSTYSFLSALAPALCKKSHHLAPRLPNKAFDFYQPFQIDRYMTLAFLFEHFPLSSFASHLYPSCVAYQYVHIINDFFSILYINVTTKKNLYLFFI